MRKSILLITFTALILCAGCAQTDGKAGKGIAYGPSTHFESDPSPVVSRVSGNPLDYAGARLGIDVRNFELPRSYETGYRFACRFPIIDFVSNQPLFMKQWTEDSAGRISLRHRDAGMLVVNDCLEILRGTADFPQCDTLKDADAAKDFNAGLAKSGFTEKYGTELGRLCADMLLASRLVTEARKDLTDDDVKFFDANPGYFVAPDGKKMPELTGDVGSFFKFIERARRVRFEYIFLAAKTLAESVGRYTAATKGWGTADFFRDPAKAGATFELQTPFGPLVVAGCGDDTHKTDAALIIDLGGNDVYANNAGGCRSMKERAALCIDHSGDDQYSAPDQLCVQGFGFCGVGMLIDLGGNDRYISKHFSQGAGIMGVGVLHDAAGDDSYICNAFCQGAGAFGLGALLDSAGEDFYECATLGQGAGMTLGLGVISDLAGDDRYYACVTGKKDALNNLPGYSQGGGVSFRQLPAERSLTPYGGVGLLVDSEGNDRYRAGGWNSQGGSYIMSLGALVDMSGNDHYSGGTAQGSGIHITNAIFIDKDGNDIYEGGFRAGGSGSDRSPGFFIDYRGNDIYNSSTASYGTSCKPFGLSIFVDYEGSDKYVSKRPKGPIVMNDWDSFGGIWPESEPHMWPYAICLDLGGKDDYEVRNHRNDSERQSFGHGIHLDMEWNGGDVFGEIKNPLPPYTDSTASRDSGGKVPSPPEGGEGEG
ncbi:MAG: hypothetical protein RDV41_10550, partial [Planctomycetota bacterium]|nr:hypothetical protein [Planctomycetota bacterium]